MKGLASVAGRHMAESELAQPNEQRFAPVQSAIRRLVPDFLLRQRSIISNSGATAGWNYATLCFRDAIGMRASNRRLIPPSSRSLLFVCFGNIMRSPMAEALMRRELAETRLDQKIEVASAGLHATAGREAHPWALEAAGGLGISLVHHRAKPLTKEMVDRADCVFAMDFLNKAELVTKYPEAKNKICLLGAYADGERRYREIPDPYLGDLEATKSCYQELQTCVRNIMASTFSIGDVTTMGVASTSP